MLQRKFPAFCFLVLGLLYLWCGTVSADAVEELLPFLTGVPEHRFTGFEQGFSFSPLCLLSNTDSRKHTAKPGWRTETFTLGLVKEDLLRIRQGEEETVRWEAEKVFSSFTFTRSSPSDFRAARFSVMQRSPSLTITDPQSIRSYDDESFLDNFDMFLARGQSRRRYGVGYRARDASRQGLINYRWYRSNDALFNQFLYDPMSEFFGGIFTLSAARKSKRFMLESEHEISSRASLSLFWMEHDGDLSYSAGYFNSDRNRDEELNVPGSMTRNVRGLKLSRTGEHRLKPGIFYFRSKVSTGLRFLPVGANPATDITDYGIVTLDGDGELWGAELEYTASKRTRWWFAWGTSDFHYRMNMRLSTPVLNFILFIPNTHRAWALSEIQMPFDLFRLGVERTVNPRCRYHLCFDYLGGDYLGEAIGETQMSAGLVTEYLEERRNLVGVRLVMARLGTDYRMTRNVSLSLGVTGYYGDQPDIINPDAALSTTPSGESKSEQSSIKGGLAWKLSISYRY